MKSTLLLLVCLVTGLIHGPSTDIMGKWKLQKLETGGKTMYPKKFDFIVTFTAASIMYNQESNKCTAKVLSITDNTIKLAEPVCSEIPTHDSISIYLDYSGAYTLHDSLLTITNDNGKFYLKRQ
jgi:hypothetical protein